MNKKPPQHIAIIPDGNRRWARAHKLIAWKGHEKGLGRFQEIIEAVFRAGISYLTFWAASEDNLTKRSKIEVKFLLSLLYKVLEKEVKEKTFVKNKIRFNVIGRWKEILKDALLERTINQLEKETKHFTHYHLTILFGYDGKREMIEAIKKLKIENKKLKINYDDVKKALWTGHLPAVDLVIRTGGEPHWSAGFMMWLTSDSQFYFTKTLWPDFDTEEFQKALFEYAKRERRFGR